MMPLAGLEALDNLSNAVQNASKGITTWETFPPELCAFALTLQVYSNKAYEYIQKTFCLALQHVCTLQDWSASINGNSGFVQEAFNMFGDKVSMLQVTVMWVMQYLLKHINVILIQ